MKDRLEHVHAAERALREQARKSRGGERARFDRHAAVLAQVQRDFQERPLSEGALAQRELVDALLDGTDALRLKADAERRAQREARPPSWSARRTRSWSWTASSEAAIAAGEEPR